MSPKKLISAARVAAARNVPQQRHDDDVRSVNEAEKGDHHPEQRYDADRRNRESTDGIDEKFHFL